jgi:hypothetical protein
MYSLPIPAKNTLDAQEAFHTLLVEVWFVYSESTDIMFQVSQTPGFYPKSYVKAINFSIFSKGSDRSGIRMYGLLKPYVRCWTAVFLFSVFFFLKYRTCYVLYVRWHLDPGGENSPALDISNFDLFSFLLFLGDIRIKFN